MHRYISVYFTPIFDLKWIYAERILLYLREIASSGEISSWNKDSELKQYFAYVFDVA